MKTLIAIITLLGIFLTSVYFLIDEKNYNLILMVYISNNVVKGSEDIEDKIRLLRNFVHDNVLPIPEENADSGTVAFDKLVSGIGWCDQQSRVFMQLAKRQNIRTRLLFLQDENGSSPHSIAEAWDGEKWDLVDLSFNLELINGKHNMASMDEVEKNLKILTENPKIKTATKFNASWKDKKFLSIYTRTPTYVVEKKGANCKIFNYIPNIVKRLFLDLINEIYLFRNKKDFTDFSKKNYFKARIYYLTGRPIESEKLFLRLLIDDEDRALKDKIRFFYALSLRDSGKYYEALEILTDLIDNRSYKDWLTFSYGLRSQIYRIIGDEEASKKDFDKIKGYINAYF